MTEPGTDPSDAPEPQVPVLAVLDIGTTLDAAGGQWPTVVVAAAEHPEVADLARVHAIDGIGDIATEAVIIDDVLVLGVIVTVPVRCVFALAFSLGVHRQVLDDAAAAGHLVIATTDPADAEADQPLWLAIDLDAELLRNVLGEA